MKVYVVEMWSDIHNCGYESDQPVVFSNKEKADEYAKSLFEKYYSEFKDGLDFPDEGDGCHWINRPDDEYAGWSFNTYREDRLECDVYETEVIS